MVNKRHVLSVFGSFLVHLVIGTVYITGNVTVYFASYLRIHDKSVNLSQLNTIFPIQLVMSCFTIYLGTRMYARFGAQVTSAVGNSMVVLAVFCTSFVDNLAAYLALYGAVYGAGVGLTYTSPLMLSWSHFPEYKTRISGIIIGAYGLGSAIFGLVATSIVNPDNESPHIKKKDGGVTYHYFKDSVAENVPEMLRYLALIYLVFSIVGILLMTKKSEIDVKEDSDDCAPSVKAALKTRQFWLLSVCSIGSTFYGYYLATTYKSFGDEAIGNDTFLAAVGSAGAFANGSSRFAWAYLMERTSFKFAFMILLGVQAALSATIYFIAPVPALYFIWVALSLSCEGGNFSLFPALLAKLHGKLMGGKVYSFFFLNFGVSSLLVLFVTLFITPHTGYLPVFLVCSAFTVGSFILVLRFKEVSPWKNGYKELLLDEYKSSPESVQTKY
mmetsp:Transcript_15802/g.28903  ORF Transcript_15802/g.28903 Transcript_15802/m.28903 type:complete len:442 (-) Transcript_15802:1469-2794(-)